MASDEEAQIIYLLFEDARWTVNTEIGTGVYPVAPVIHKWTVNEKTKVFMMRTAIH